MDFDAIDRFILDLKNIRYAYILTAWMNSEEVKSSAKEEFKKSFEIRKKYLMEYLKELEIEDDE